MLNHKTHLIALEKEVKPTHINITLSDSPDCNVMVVLPSAMELRDFESIAPPTISINEMLKNDPFNLRAMYENYLSQIHSKYERFKSDSTYLMHLANLSSLSGFQADAEGYLNAALTIKNDAFIKHELGAVLLDQEKNDDAQALFNQCDLNQDVYANLRLAFISIKRNDIEKAEQHTRTALEIDNTDYKARMLDGAIHIWKRDWEKAVRSFRVAAEENNTSSVLFANLAAAYWGLGEEEKALRSLKKALSLNPTNENAALFLADATSILGVPGESIPYLENILLYEQKNDVIWEKLARAYYEFARSKGDDRKLLNKSLEALRTLTSLRNDSGIWNNIGVIYSLLQQKQKAQRFYAQSLIKAKELNEDTELPLSNLLSVLIELKKYREVFKLSGEYLKARNESQPITRSASRILVNHIVSMEALGERSKAADKAEHYIGKNSSDPEAECELLIHIFFYRTLINPNIEIIKKYIPYAMELVKEHRNISESLHSRILNNIVFALLEFDELDYAELHMGSLSRWVHKDPYSTATLGLYHIKKGNLERARRYYDEAITMVGDKDLKQKFRQRMNIEIGKKYLKEGNLESAKQFIQKAIYKKHGSNYADDEASAILRLLQ